MSNKTIKALFLLGASAVLPSIAQAGFTVTPKLHATTGQCGVQADTYNRGESGVRFNGSETLLPPSVSLTEARAIAAAAQASIPSSPNPTQIYAVCNKSWKDAVADTLGLSDTTPPPRQTKCRVVTDYANGAKGQGHFLAPQVAQDWVVYGNSKLPGIYSAQCLAL